MTNLKDENKRQNNNIKEGTEKFADKQKQHIDNTISNISETTNKFNDNINEYQRSNNQILDKSIDFSNKYQQQTSNAIQTISNNYVELQNNVLNTYQSALSEFLDNVSKSYWNYFRIPERYTDVDNNKINQNITDNTVNATRRLNEFISKSTEAFNKSIEITQKYYNDSVQSYFNFVNKVE